MALLQKIQKPQREKPCIPTCFTWSCWMPLLPVVSHHTLLCSFLLISCIRVSQANGRVLEELPHSHRFIFPKAFWWRCSAPLEELIVWARDSNGGNTVQVAVRTSPCLLNNILYMSFISVVVKNDSEYLWGRHFYWTDLCLKPRSAKCCPCGLGQVIWSFPAWPKKVIIFTLQNYWD